MPVGLNYRQQQTTVARLVATISVFVAATVIAIGMIMIATSRNCTAQDSGSSYPAIIKQLNGTPEERTSALKEILESLPPFEPKGAVPRLVEILQTDPSMKIRGLSVQVLARMGPEADIAVPALIEFLKNRNFGFERAYVPNALATIHENDEQAAAALIDALEHDQEPAVRQASARALGELGAREAVPSLIRAIRTGDKDLRDAAVYGLMRVPATPGDLPALTAMLSDPVDSVRGAAASSIGGARSAAAGVLPILIKLLDDESPDVRGGAAEGLGRMGKTARAALPALKKVSDDKVVHFAVYQAIWNIKNNN